LARLSGFSADLTPPEKDLMVLQQGVIEGRKVFANIVKYIRMGASSNFGNMFSVLRGSARFGVAAPNLASLRAMYRRAPTLIEHQQISCDALGFQFHASDR
jgi:hypothetical protein